MIGPTIGAIFVAASGTSLAFGLDSASFRVGAGFLLPVRNIRPPFRAAEPAAPRASALRDLRDGWQMA